MVEIATKSLFGKKPLIEEQVDLYFASEHIDFASALLDKNIMGKEAIGSQVYETIFEVLSEKKRHEKAREHYQKALEYLNKVM
jgi:tetratricopeptide (TPR) repeat protein